MMRGLRFAVGVLLLAACGGDDAEEAREAARDSAAARPPAPTMTEPQVIMAIMVADAADSAVSAIAVQRADAAAVRSYAQRMVRDHASINEQLAVLAGQLGIEPAANTLSAQLGTRGEQTLAQLQSTVPSAFDSAYLASEIAAHSAYLDALDRHMVPSAQHADLKYTVQHIRRAVAVHLAVAQRLQAEQRRARTAAAARPAPAADGARQSSAPEPAPQPVRPPDTTTQRPVMPPPVRDTTEVLPPPRRDTIPPPVRDSIRG